MAAMTTKTAPLPSPPLTHTISAHTGRPHLSPEENLRKTLNELQVHQIELQMQNEELRVTERELGISQTRYFDLYDLAPVGYLTIDEQGKILEANLTVATMVGALRGELINRRIFRYISAEDRDAFYLYCQRLLQSGSAGTCELRMLKISGNVFWANINGIAVEDTEHGKPTYRIVINDITELKQLDTIARQSLEKTTAANSTMNRLLRTIAHEFRTPLGLLSASTDILDRYWDELTPEKRFTQNELIRDAVYQLTTLVSSVTSYNTLGEESIGYHPLPHNLADLCSAIAAGVEYVWNRGQQWSITIADNCGTALADEGLLRRVIENLLTNAFRYTPAGGRVTLSVHREKNVLSIEISDTGIGIPQEDLPHIFDPFYRSRNIDGRRGLGLGLTIVHEALMQMGGTITTTSSVGSGTVMAVQIPAAIPG
jgi:PAS domain S-box-containing protein